MLDRINSSEVSKIDYRITTSKMPAIEKPVADMAEIEVVDKASISAGVFRSAAIENLPTIIKHRLEEREALSGVAENPPSLVTKDSTKKEIMSKPPKFITEMDDNNPSFKDIMADKTKIASKEQPPQQSQGIDVGPFEKELKDELGPLSRIQNPYDIEGLKGRVASMKELKEIFSEVVADKSIPYEYLPDGCYARAHVAAKKFLDKGVNCAKLYVMLGDIDWNDPFHFPTGRFRAKNKFTEGEWWYHVAPVVFAKDDETGKVDGYVIDPAVNKERPLKGSEWIKAFWSQDFKIVFDTTHADIYEPQLEDPNNLPREFSQEVFDSWMPEAIKTNAEYSEILAKIKEDYYAHHPEQAPQNG